MKKSVVINVFLGMLILAILMVSCTARTKVRWHGDIDLGALPSDMSFDASNNPRIISISTESDGDILMVYYSTSNRIVAQLYGCGAVSLNCGKLYKQGSYSWATTLETPESTESPLHLPTLADGEYSYYIRSNFEIDQAEITRILANFQLDQNTETLIKQHLVSNYYYYLNPVTNDEYIIFGPGPVSTTMESVYDSESFEVFSDRNGLVYVLISSKN